VRYEILESLSEQAYASKHWDEGYLIDSYLTRKHPETPIDSERVQSSREKAREIRVSKLNHWARTFTDAGKPEKALAFWRQLLEFDLPDSDRIRQTIRQIELELSAGGATRADGNFWRRLAVVAVLGAAAVVILGIIFGPRIWKGVSPAEPGQAANQTETSPVPTFTVSLTDSAQASVAATDASQPEAGSEETVSTGPSGITFNDRRVLNPQNQHLYLLIEEDKTWHGAREHCESIGGYLVTIQDASENEYVHGLFPDVPDGSGFLGASDEDEEGTWQWVTGEPWEFTNWAVNEPNNAQINDASGEDYLSLQQDSMWNDLDYGSSAPFVCEWGPGSPGFDPDVLIALEAIQGEEPDFQHNFDFWDLGISDDQIWIEDGRLMISSKEWGDMRYLELVDLVTDRFAVQFDLSILESGSDQGRCYVQSLNNPDGRPSESLRNILAGFTKSGHANLEHYQHPESWPAIAANRFQIADTNTITLLVLGDKVISLADGQVIYTVTDPDGDAIYYAHGLSAEGGIVCAFDNFRVWDLGKVDFSAAGMNSPIDPATRNALQIIQKEQPDYHSTDDNWGGMANSVENVSIENGNLVINNDNLSETDVSLPEDGRPDGDKFAIEFGLQLSEPGDRASCSLELGTGQIQLRNIFNSDGGVQIDHLVPDGEETTIGVGRFNAENPNTIKLIVLEDRISLFMNSQLVISEGDPKGSFFYTDGFFQAGHPVTCQFDNYKFWDLRDEALLKAASDLNPEVQTALEIITSEEPTYQTSFDTWEFGNPVENVSIENGTLLFTTANYQFPLVQISSIPSEYFAVEFDLTANQDIYCTFETYNGDDSDTLRRGLSAGFNPTGPVNIQHFVPPNDYINIADNRTYPFNSAGKYRMRLLFLGDQISAFINDELIYTAQNPDGVIPFKKQFLSTSPNGVCEFDNYKIWDLSDAPIFDTASDLPPEVQTALEIITTEEPRFSDDFEDQALDSWHGKVSIDDGKLHVTSENQQHSGMDVSNLYSDRFAVEFDARILDASPGGHCVFEASNKHDNDSTKREISVGFFARGTVELSHHVYPDGHLEIKGAVSPIDTSKSNKALLLFLGDQVSVFINGQLAFEARDSLGSTYYDFQALSANYSINCEFDNYRIWDLQFADIDP
jgi:hypothetical protein